MTGISVRRAERRIDVQPARAEGDALVHLAAPGLRHCLCGRATRPRTPTKSFRVAGCAECRRTALDAGHVAVQESDRAWVSLLRA